jgi:O-antigen ligase
MPPLIATIIFVIGIFGLFWLDRHPDEHTSKALWIPVIWLAICASRPVSSWVLSAPAMDLRVRYLEGSPLDAAIWGVLLIAGLMVLLCRVQAATELVNANLALILYFTYCGVSILWADYPFVSFKRWIKAVGDVVMILVVLTDNNKLLAIQRLLTRVSFVLIPVSVLLNKYYPNVARAYNRHSWELMYSGVTTGKNLLGMTCLLCGLASLWSLLLAHALPKGKERRRRELAHGVILLMVLWLLHIAHSMTSLACLGLGSLVMLFIRRAKPVASPLRIHVAATAVVLVAVFALFLDSSGVLVRSLGRNPTLTGRTAIWSAVWVNSSNSVIGAGFESYWMGDRMVRVWNILGSGAEGIQEAHNGYLEVYLNLGWMGIVFLALVLLVGYRRIVAAFRWCPDAALLMLSYFVTGIVFGLTEAAFRMMAPVWISLLLAMTAVSRHLWVPSAAVPEIEGQASLPFRSRVPVQRGPSEPEHPVVRMRRLREGA